MNPKRKTVWSPSSVLNLEGELRDYCIIILNTPLNLKPDILLPLWTKAKLRILADGGANQWLEYTEKLSCTCDASAPNYVVGDMDSITESTTKHFSSLSGVQILVKSSQDETDFTKAAKLALEPKYSSGGIDYIIAVAESTGRLDQIMANINTLHRMCRTAPEKPLYQLSSDSLSWILVPGIHEICIPETLVASQMWCGLIPCGSKCNKISTSGLKWDLRDQSMEFGELVSSSNTYQKGTDKVTVVNDTKVLWTMGLMNACYINTSF